MPRLDISTGQKPALYEDEPDPIGFWSRMITTKTFWTGVSSIAGGIALCCAQDFPMGVPMIIAGLGMIFVRDAIATTATQPPPPTK